MSPSPDQLKSLLKSALGQLEGARLAKVLVPIFTHLEAPERLTLLEALLNHLPAHERTDLLSQVVGLLPTQGRVDVGFAALSGSVDDARPQVVELTRLLFRSSETEPTFAASEQIRGFLTQNQASLEHLLQVYTNYATHLARAGVELSGARVLEFGPGHSLLGGVLLVAWGAASYCGADPFPIARLDAARVAALRARCLGASGLPLHEPALAERQRALVARLDELVRVEGEGVVIDERISYLADDAAALSAPDASFELVISNSVLEHVRDLNAAARECARVLTPGGLALHLVDLRDHRDFSRPRAFLRDDEAAWERACGARDAFDYTNRARRSEVRAAFTAAGLELVSEDVYERAPLAPGERASFAPAFAELPEEELEALGVSLLLRKPAE